MKTLISIILMSIVLLNVYSQDTLTGNAITIQKRKYYQNDERLKSKQLFSILESNPASEASAKSARMNANVSSVFVLCGSVCVLAGSITSLSSALKENKDVQNGNLSGEYNSGLGWLGAGLGCILVAVPFSITSRKHLNTSVEQYNSSIASSRQPKLKFEMMAGSDGLGIRMRF